MDWLVALKNTATFHDRKELLPAQNSLESACSQAVRKASIHADIV